MGKVNKPDYPVAIVALQSVFWRQSPAHGSLMTGAAEHCSPIGVTGRSGQWW
jgi:hypothetical protein